MAKFSSDGIGPFFSVLGVSSLGVTSCPPSKTPYTRDVTIFYISALSMLFDICDQSCWQSRVTPVEIRVDVLALCIHFFYYVVFDAFVKLAENEASFWVTLQTTMCICSF